MIKKILILFLLLNGFSSNAQFKYLFSNTKKKIRCIDTAQRKLSFDSIGWTISIPVNYYLNNDSVINSMLKNGTDIWDSLTGLNVSRESHTLFVASKPFDNNITALVLSYKGKPQFWTTLRNIEKQLFLTALKYSQKDNSFDSSSSVEIIDGKQYDKFLVDITLPDSRVLHIVDYAKCDNNCILEILYTYMYKEEGDALEDSVKKSYFYNPVQH